MVIPLLKLALLMAVTFGVLMRVTRPLVHQARQFLHDQGGPPLTRLQIRAVTLTFASTGTVLVATTVWEGSSWWPTAKVLTLLGLGIPMVLLDMRNFWLPLRFTSGFWLTGLLFTLLPGSSLSLMAALIGSGGMFIFLYAFYLVAKRLRGEEGIGLGDVHLIAALCAWLPWSLASLLSGGAFLLFIVGALLTGKTAQPYAPWLFALLAGLTSGFPHLTLSGVL